MKKSILLALGFYTISVQTLVKAMSINPTKNQILTQNNGKVTVWNLDTGAKAFELSHKLPANKNLQHLYKIDSAFFNPQGNQIATFARKKATVWNAQSGQQLFTLESDDIVESKGRFSGDGKKILTGSEFLRKFQIWDAQNGTKLTEKTTNKIGSSAAINYDGSKIAISENNILTVYDIKTDTSITLEHKPEELIAVNGILFDLTGNQVITFVIDKNNNHQIQFWSIVDAKRIATFPSSSMFLPSLAFDKNNAKMAFVSNKTTATILDPSGKIVTELSTTKPNWALNRITISQDGSKAFVIEGMTRAVLWDISDNKSKVILTLEDEADLIFDAYFNHNGSTIITDGRKIKVWNANNGKLLSTIKY